MFSKNKKIMKKKKLKLWIMSIPFVFLASCIPMVQQYMPSDHMLSKSPNCEPMGGDKNEGVFGYFMDSQIARTIPVYECFFSDTGDHMTVNDKKVECTGNGGVVANNGDPLGYVFLTRQPGAGAVPKYRCSFPDGDTMMAHTQNQCTDNGGTLQGWVFYVFPTQLTDTHPVYRCYAGKTPGSDGGPGPEQQGCGEGIGTERLDGSGVDIGIYNIKLEPNGALINIGIYEDAGDIFPAKFVKMYRKQNQGTDNDVYYFINPNNGKQYLMDIKINRESCSIDEGSLNPREDTTECELVTGTPASCPLGNYIKNLYDDGTVKKILCCSETIDTDLKDSYLSRA